MAGKDAICVDFTHSHRVAMGCANLIHGAPIGIATRTLSPSGFSAMGTPHVVAPQGSREYNYYVNGRYFR